MKIKIICIIGLFTFCALTLQAQEDFGMRMHVINVGQAESILLEFQNHAILVDAGAEIVKNKDKTKDYVYANYLKNYLKDFFKRRDDLKNTFYAVVNSHPHPDHANRFRRDIFIKEHTIKSFIESGDNNDDYGYINKEYLTENKITHYKLDDEKLGETNGLADWGKELREKSGVNIKFLDGYRNCNDENNFSLVMHVSYKGKSFLLTGDGEVDDTDYDRDGNIIKPLCTGLIPHLLANYQNDLSSLKADVYKLGHHGSHNGTSEDFINVIKPQYAVISAGNRNVKNYSGFGAANHGHPRIDTIKALLKEKSLTTRPSVNASWFKRVDKKNILIEKPMTKAIYCTCWDENVIFTVNRAGDNISVEMKKSE